MSIIQELEDLIDYKIPREQILDDYIVDTLLHVTEKVNREIIIVLDSSNKIVVVGIGQHDKATLPDIEKLGKKRGLSGLRSFHTHPNFNPSLSSADKSLLIQMRLDLIGAIGKDRGNKPLINIGLLNVEDDDIIANEYGPYSTSSLNALSIREHNEFVDKVLRSQVVEEILEEERAVLVGVNSRNEDTILEIDDSIKELGQLAHTAGATPVATLVQNKEKVDNTFYIGKGKLEELSMLIQNNKANLVICNDELTSVQLRVMEDTLGVKIIDRTSLILDIFAKHATTMEGKLQVELAQLEYRLPRLLGMGKVLSRTGGGIGTRGPGEKKLETDRRAIYREINILEKRIASMKKVREQQKSRRTKNQIPTVSLVGYTNAGKSTLFNLLTNSDVLSEDKLFATLDATTRRFKEPIGDALLSDTVGFIDKLPHDLVKAFESTLEDVVESDLLLHVVDASNEQFTRQIQLVEDVLHDLNAHNKKAIYVFNKIDAKCDQFEEKYATIRGTKVKVSAKYETGIEELFILIQRELFGQREERIITIPYEDIAMISRLYDLGMVLEEKYVEDGVKVKIQYTKETEYLVEKYL